jgi:hypothetical protein
MSFYDQLLVSRTRRGIVAGLLFNEWQELSVESDHNPFLAVLSSGRLQK